MEAHRHITDHHSQNLAEDIPAAAHPHLLRRPVRCWLLCTSDESHIAQCAALSNTCVRPLALQHRYRVSGPRISAASRSRPCNLLSHAIQHFLIDNRAEHNTTISSFFSIQVMHSLDLVMKTWREHLDF